MGSKYQENRYVTNSPNRIFTVAESLYLRLLSIFGHKSFLIKLFDNFSNCFIPPDYEPSLPRHLVAEATQLALKNFEINKRDQLWLSKFKQGNTLRDREHLMSHGEIYSERLLNVFNDVSTRATPNEHNAWKHAADNQCNGEENLTLEDQQRDSSADLKRIVRERTFACKIKETDKTQDHKIDKKLNVLQEEINAMHKMIRELVSAQQQLSNTLNSTVFKNHN